MYQYNRQNEIVPEGKTQPPKANMNSHEIQQKKQQVVARYGRWTAHNIELGDGTYTIGDRIVGDEIKLRRILQLICDISTRPLSELRILDLACLEGLYAVELARHGAKVVAIEGREANLAKTAFAKEVLSLENLDLIHDDVRNLSEERHGRFDVVLCLGILYHLDFPDLFPFLARIAEVCGSFAVFDTHVSLSPELSREFDGDLYWGRVYREHMPDSTSEERYGRVWASLDNLTSFWFTRHSLYRALARTGFTSTFECHWPPEPEKGADRVTLLAMRGRRENLKCSPLVAAKPIDAVPEFFPINSLTFQPILCVPAQDFPQPAKN
jgi:2-polyprenyl-3-methyl-5-hydroxy-6-metoxy-1,4-benzoquinol methylase